MLSAWPISFLALPALVSSYSFQLRSAPKQCGNVDLEITEGQGKPPYKALVVPFGSSPTNPERRRIFEHQFNDGNTSFQMPYPTNGGFVITVSDQNGAGTGGTSVPQTVAPGDDSSCLIDPSTAKNATFSFQVLPNTAISQCDNRTLAWDNKAVGDVKITVVIPGGQTFGIPTDHPMTGLQGGTTGVLWVVNIRTGTNIVIVAGDDNGPGSGGSFNTAVGNNPNGDDSCISNNSPSSTPGTPAGAVETGGTTQPSSGSSTNVGAIAGGVIGGIVGVLVLILVAWFIMRRRRQHRRADVDLLPEGEGGNNQEFYQPEPFIVPSSATGTGTRPNTDTRPSMSDVGRRYSALSTTDEQFSESNYTSTTPAFAPSREFLSASGSRSNASRKSPGGPPTLRPVNVVQHEDGGEVVPLDGEGETIELPPAYTAVGSSRKDLGSSATQTSDPTAAGSSSGRA